MKATKSKYAHLTDEQVFRMLYLKKFLKATKVTPKLEAFRGLPKVFMGVRGGRGAGGKTRSCISLLVDYAHREKHSIILLREIQKTIEDSSYRAIEQHVERVGYEGWVFTNTTITTPIGSKFVFRGLKDWRASNNLKGMESFDTVFLDEAAHISKISLDLLLPTVLRQERPRILFAYNPEDVSDPITTMVWNKYKDRPDKALMIEVRPGKEDNPHFPPELQDHSDMLKEDNYNEWLHIYGGQPRTQGHDCIISRTSIAQAAEYNIKERKGIIQIGVDVARYGDDKTVAYMRHGNKVIDCKRWSKQDTITSAKEIWAMANKDPSIPIVIDEPGVGGGVYDYLDKETEAKVIGFNGGEKAKDSNTYVNKNAEAWFTFPIDDIDIPDDAELHRQLAMRTYSYERGTDRLMVEKKKDYKKRLQCSPDDADAILLCFYSPQAGQRYFARSNKNAMLNK